MFSVALLSLTAADDSSSLTTDIAFADLEHPREIDFQSLVEMDGQKALNHYQSLWSVYMAMKPQRSDVVLKLSSSLGRNPSLPSYFEKNIERYPVLAENTRDREKIVGYLGGIPAEWAVRLLFRLVLENKEIRSERYDLKKTEDLEYLAFQQNIMLETATNSSIARFEIIRMHLFEWPGESLKQEVNETWSDFQKRVLTRQLNWIYSNQSRIPEIVKKTWGDKAVLNADLGLGPDNLPIKSGPALGQTGAPERIHSGAVAGQKQESEANQRSDSWFWLGMTIFLVGIAIIVWRRKVKYDNP